jgi:NADH-quinone oxidoreductase subunit H
MFNDLVNSYGWQQIFVLPGGQIEWWAEVVRSVLRLVLGLAGTLGLVPLMVWYERRLLGWLQGRLGPNRVGPQGLMQPLADALKLMMKEDIIPTNVDRTLYVLAPGIALVPVILSIMVLPWNGSPSWGAVAPAASNGILLLLAIASIEVYGVMMAGWSSNNKYSLLGGLRASSQVISYELGMGLSILAVMLMSGSLIPQAIVQGTFVQDTAGHVTGILRNGQGVVIPASVPNSDYWVFQHSITSGFWDWNLFRFFPFGFIAFGIYLISMIAETNRAPFDLPEAETELVAGFHTEYSSFKFAMFFMGEYANMVIVSSIAVTLFLGGWLGIWGALSQFPASLGAYVPAWLLTLANTLLSLFWFALKLFTLLSFFVLVRATFPRLRYDMLMKFGWKGLLPVALTNLFLIAVAIAVRQEFARSAGPGTPAFVATAVGVAVALAIAAVILVILLFARKGRYEAERKAAKTTSLAPIRRGSVVVPTPPAPTEL